MSIAAIKTVGVIGAGTMGNGMAQVFAQSGFDVRLFDAAAGAVDRARANIDKSLGKFVEKGKLTAENRDAAMARITPAAAIEDPGAVHYIVEAIVENAERG